MLTQWFKPKKLSSPPPLPAKSEIHLPAGLVPVMYAGVDPRSLQLNSAREFLSHLQLDNLAGIDFTELGRPAAPFQRSLRAGILSWSEKGLVIVMRKTNSRFDIGFKEIWAHLRRLGVGEAKKSLVENRVLWNWKWEAEGTVCNLSYWNILDDSKDEGLRFSCLPQWG